MGFFAEDDMIPLHHTAVHSFNDAVHQQEYLNYADKVAFADLKKLSVTVHGDHFDIYNGEEHLGHVEINDINAQFLNEKTAAELDGETIKLNTHKQFLLLEKFDLSNDALKHATHIRKNDEDES